MTVSGKVLRKRGDLHGTPGRMILSNGFSADALELPWMNNERGRSCTAPGLDVGRVWWSPTLKRLVVRFAPRNGRQDCLIHNGNWASEAEGEITQVHGCTEVGRGYGEIERPDGKKQWGIKFSGATLAELIESLAIDGEDHGLDADGYAAGYHDVQIEYAYEAGEEPADLTA